MKSTTKVAAEITTEDVIFHKTSNCDIISMIVDKCTEKAVHVKISIDSVWSAVPVFTQEAWIPKSQIRETIDENGVKILKLNPWFWTNAIKMYRIAPEFIDGSLV